MRQAFLLAGLAALAAGSPAAQAINFASVDAAPSLSLTGPAPGVNTQDIPYNSASVSAKDLPQL
jgi:sugar/nucleoside kinase (ribokinase family)